MWTGLSWFLRGVISGAAVPVTIRLPPPRKKYSRTVVVDRGDDPRPPRELLPMTLPADLIVAAEEEPAVEQETENEHSKLRPMPRRGLNYRDWLMPEFSNYPSAFAGS